MKASEARMLDFLKESPQFAIPIYQRTYSWTERECRQLWDDIVRAGSSEAVSAHFIGSIVYIQQGLYHVSSHQPLLVIDGQQRLTTISLLLAALAEALESNDGSGVEPVEGFSPLKLRHYYLLNPVEAGEKYYKLLLSQADRDTLKAIVAGMDVPNGCSQRVVQNYDLFRSWIAESKQDLTPICKGLAKLVVVDISLDRDQDNPQLIFESMNSTGRELTQADLIRNYVLMGLEPEVQTRLYEGYWRPMEVGFGQAAYATHFDGFMRHYLTVKTGEIPNVRQVYEAFKTHARSSEVAAAGVETLVHDLRDCARHYCAMALGAEPDPALDTAFHDLRELRVDVAYPFLLVLYHDYADGRLSRDDLLAAVRLVEAYVFRRAVCAMPTNSLNKTFATFASALDRERYLESIQAHFQSMPSYRRLPDDNEFSRELKTRDLYNFRSRTYFLRRLENHGRKERVSIDQYTIEHILPQNERLSEAWHKELGPNWEQVRSTWLHTLGNLTLTGYNSEYSDRPFPAKRDMKGGFAESPLRLNQGLGQLGHWNEAAIKARASRLADAAVNVWSAPRLAESALTAHKTRTAATEYSMSDHPNLRVSPVREIFDAFRQEVLALDPCVSEEYLKYYVAYKAETNFADIVPQAKRLRVTLNMDFAEVVDPKSVCKDVAGLGHWGNGDVEVGLETLDDLPYVVGLVRQSLEKQLGNGAEL